jgi:hypothetical protein
MAEEQSPQTPHPLQWVRAADFEQKYANNVTFETSDWDLRVVFGTLDQGAPDQKTYGHAVKFHTAISVPWRQAKLMAYSACVNVLLHEMTEGKIQIPFSPPPVEALVKDVIDTPAEQKLVKLDRMLRAVLFDEQTASPGTVTKKSKKRTSARGRVRAKSS